MGAHATTEREVMDSQRRRAVMLSRSTPQQASNRQIQPSLTQFAEKYTDVDFIKIDVDELHDVAEEFGVQAMPKGGKVVDKVVGAKREDKPKEDRETQILIQIIILSGHTLALLMGKASKAARITNLFNMTY